MEKVCRKSEAASAHPVDILIGQNIRKWRRRRNLSMRELASGVGITMQQLQKYEVASNRISVSRLVELAEALEVTPLTLLGKAGYPQPSQEFLEKASQLILGASEERFEFFAKFILHLSETEAGNLRGQYDAASESGA